MMETVEAATAVRMDMPKPSVSAGTIMIPPPKPSMDPTTPAAIPIRNISMNVITTSVTPASPGNSHPNHGALTIYWVSIGMTNKKTIRSGRGRQLPSNCTKNRLGCLFFGKSGTR